MRLRLIAIKPPPEVADDISSLPAITVTLPAPQIVAGVLVKFVNLGKGWRSRLFVLKHGVLRYYRVRAMGACRCDCKRMHKHQVHRWPAFSEMERRRCSACPRWMCNSSLMLCGPRVIWRSLGLKHPSLRANGDGAPMLSLYSLL